MLVVAGFGVCLAVDVVEDGFCRDIFELHGDAGILELVFRVSDEEVRSDFSFRGFLDGDAQELYGFADGGVFDIVDGDDDGADFPLAS